MSKSFNILSLSDIHLGSKRTTTEYIINNLDTYVSNNEVLANVDLLILAGDIFDTLLSLPHPDVYYIDLWISRLLKLCYKHNVKIRILEGTPSHDRMQSERFTIINSILENKADLHYASTLSVEHIESLDLNILYVPDEWSNSAEQTLSEVKELMVSKQLSKVDYAIMHGTFDYQLGDIKNIPRHSSFEYSQLVNHLIFVGHIHQYSQSGKIIAHGSFDRLGFGEKEAKGLVFVNVINDKHIVNFIENKNAKKYVTYDSINEDLDTLINRLDKKITKLPDQSYVRIRTNKESVIMQSLEVLKLRYLKYFITVVKIEDKKASIVMVQEVPKYTPIIISKNNITELITDRLFKLQLDSKTSSDCLTILNEVI